MREEDLAAVVDALHDRLVVLVAADVAEADEREVPGRAHLPARLVLDPLLEERGQADVLAQDLLQALAAEAAQRRPQLQRAEAPAERRGVLAEADDVLV